jgi:hypothetical protein
LPDDGDTLAHTLHLWKYMAGQEHRRPLGDALFDDVEDE